MASVDGTRTYADGEPVVPMTPDLSESLRRIVAAGYTYRLEVVRLPEDDAAAVSVGYVCRSSDEVVVAEWERVYRYQVKAAPPPLVTAYRRLVAGAAETAARAAALRCERDPRRGAYPPHPNGDTMPDTSWRDEPIRHKATRRLLAATLVVLATLAVAYVITGPAPAHGATVAAQPQPTPDPDPEATTTQVRVTVALAVRHLDPKATNVGVACHAYAYQRWDCGATWFHNGRQVVLEWTRIFVTTPKAGYGFGSWSNGSRRFRAPLYRSADQTIRGFLIDAA